MNNTPETDALVPQFLNGGEIPDVFALCRKLERERDKAREALENLKASLDQIASLYESKEMTATVCQRISDAYDMRCIARQAIDQLKEGTK